jgi:hypothetical protein
VPGAGAAHQGPNVNTQLYRSLFSASQDARFLGPAGSETESGQSGLQETHSHKPPRSLGRSLTLLIHPYIRNFCSKLPPLIPGEPGCWESSSSTPGFV